MIDFVKYQLKNYDPAQLECSSLLDFHYKVNRSTGELGSYCNAYYKGLEFKIYEPTSANNYKRVTVEGSLHKYWNNGAHNFNDFGIIQIFEVLNDIKLKFNIIAECCILKTIELGVNIIPPQITKQILKDCHLLKTDSLKWIYTNDEGNYIQVKNSNHINKLYDKKTHYANKGFSITNEIMRIEKKYTRMFELNNKGIYNLEDLLKHGLINFKSDLVKMWQNVLYCDLETVKGTKNELKYTNSNWWLNILSEDY